MEFSWHQGEIAQRFKLKHHASADSSIRQSEARLHQELLLQKCMNLIKLDLIIKSIFQRDPKFDVFDLSRNL